MANHGILIRSDVAAKDVSKLNRSFIATYDIDNGNIMCALQKSTTSGEAELWVAATPYTGAHLTEMWMACEPEVVITVSGSKQYKGINPDVKDFYNIAGIPFAGFKPQVGDLIELSTDALAGTKNANGFVVATASTSKLTWAASAVSGLSLSLVATQYIPVATGTLGSTDRVVSYLFECVAQA